MWKNSGKLVKLKILIPLEQTLSSNFAKKFFVKNFVHEHLKSYAMSIFQQIKLTIMQLKIKLICKLTLKAQDMNLLNSAKVQVDFCKRNLN